jgi:predicted glycosyltransferase involved in capsule biosynthesis
MNDDFIDHILLSKPPPNCMCNSSGGDPWVYSLVACEPNVMLVLSVNQTKTKNQFAKIVTVLGEKKEKKKIFPSVSVSFFSP